jgi:hypothetical protein
MRMSVLSPDYGMVNKLSAIIDEVNIEYAEELAMNHDIDDAYALGEMLNKRTRKAKLPINWLVYDDEREDPSEWMTAMASATESSCSLEVILWETNLEGKWGPKTFKEIALKMLCHETIHFNQYNTIGLENLEKLQSGHEKGTKLKAKTGKHRDWMRLYLRDPHELMAFGHDLYEEIKLTSDPDKALRNPEAFIKELPVYNQYRNIFPSNAKPLQKLLSYTARYTNGLHKEDLHI